MDILEVIKSRRSVRKYRSEPVSEHDINRILEAGKWAPYDGKRQPWKFIVITSREVRRKLADPFPKDRCISDAPLGIAVVVNPRASDHPIEDGAAATQNMLLEAHSLGLGACWIRTYGTENEERGKEILHISEEERLLSVIAIGHPVEGLLTPMRKILLSVMALLLVLGLMGWGALAVFRYGAPLMPTMLMAGMPDLVVDGREDPEVFHFEEGPLHPSNRGTYSFNLTNVGHGLGYLTINVTAYIEDGGIHSEPEMQVDPFNDANMDELLHIRLWHEEDGNKIYEPANNETILLEGTIQDTLSQSEATSLPIFYKLFPTGTMYIGFYWEVLDDPDSNRIQGDSVSFDIEFRLLT